MTLKKNNQARNHFVKSQPRNADAEVLDQLTQTFNNFHLSYEREQTKFHTSYHTKFGIRIPDFVFKVGKLNPVLEVDKDSTHGEFPYQNQKTKERNMDHLRSGNPLAILSEDLALHLGFKKEDFGKLSVYLMWHSIAIFMAQKDLIV